MLIVFCLFFFHQGKVRATPLAFPPAAFLWHRQTQTHRQHVSSDFLMSVTDGLCHARLMAILGRKELNQGLTQNAQEVYLETKPCCSGLSYIRVIVVCIVLYWLYSAASGLFMSVTCMRFCKVVCACVNICLPVGSLCCDESVWR